MHTPATPSDYRPYVPERFHEHFDAWAELTAGGRSSAPVSATVKADAFHWPFKGIVPSPERMRS
jgi:hypothetical protein